MTIVSGSAGGPNDLIARSIAESLKSTSGLSVTVDNRAPLQVLQITSQSPPDGQTIGVVDSFSVTSFPASTANFPVDPLRDLTPIVTISATPYVLVASKRMGVTDYQGLISELKNSPGKYSYASNGFGTPSHLNAELFKALTATFITHSNMKSSATALLEISNGGASLGFFELNNVLPLIKSNQVVPIAIAIVDRIWRQSAEFYFILH
jgi:tripartite-type tricarboxylate transporter receptor subunit TctC